MGWLTRERIWPTLVIVALAANVILIVTLARIAGNDPSFAVEPDYYAKAISWDSVQAQRGRDDVLGWRVLPTLTAVTAERSPSLTLELLDREGRPVTGAEISLEAMPVAFASHVIRATLAAQKTPGQYGGPVAVDRTGLWEFRVLVVRATDRFTVNLRLDASATSLATIVTDRPGDRLRPTGAE
jgi:hypothetical protein